MGEHITIKRIAWTKLTWPWLHPWHCAWCGAIKKVLFTYGGDRRPFCNKDCAQDWYGIQFDAPITTVRRSQSAYN